MKETEYKVSRQIKEITKSVTHPLKIEKNTNQHGKEADARAEEADGDDCGGAVGVAEAARDERTDGVGEHEDGVHFGEDVLVEAGFGF